MHFDKKKTCHVLIRRGGGGQLRGWGLKDLKRGALLVVFRVMGAVSTAVKGLRVRHSAPWR